MDIDALLERAVVGRPSVERRGAGGRAANDSLQDACTRLKIVRNSFHSKEVAALLHRRACTGAYAFVVMGVARTKQVS